MNKKAYITPEMAIVEIEKNVQLLAGSLGMTDNPITPPTPGTTLAPSFLFEDDDE